MPFDPSWAILMDGRQGAGTVLDTLFADIGTVPLPFALV
jgi:hypothetical protein